MGARKKAPELNSVESEVIWIEDEFVHVSGVGDVMRGKPRKAVQFNSAVRFRAIPSVGKARKVKKKEISAQWQKASRAGGDCDDVPVDNLEECRYEGTGLDVGVGLRTRVFESSVSRLGTFTSFF